MPGRLNRRWWVMMAVSWLAGCSLIPSSPKTAPEFPLLPPASYGGSARFQQTLFLAHGADEHSLQCVVDINDKKLTVRAYSALGQRLFVVEQDGRELQTEVSAMGPKNLPARTIVNDLQFAFWPLAALQSSMRETAWRVEEPRSGLRRLHYGDLLYAELHEGKATENIRRLWLSNLLYGYTLDITSESADAGP